MYMRIIHGQTQPGQAEELARRWEEFVLPRLKDAPGLQHAYHGVDQAANTTCGVTVWDSRPDEEMMNRNLEDFRARVSDILAGPPQVEEYDVLAHR